MGFFNRGKREEHEVRCSQCGAQFNVNFVPRSGTTVSCRTCMTQRLERSERRIKLEDEISNLEGKNKRILRGIRDIEKGMNRGLSDGDTKRLAELQEELATHEREVTRLRAELQQL